jgi:HEAT repeat protein
MQAMLVEYMGKGFLENIIALFRTDWSLVTFIPAMIGDENIRVRMGATALVEELAKERPDQLRPAVAGLVALLRHENATIRGDAANVLGLIGDPSATDALKELGNDPNASVREIARDALQEIGQG